MLKSVVLLLSVIVGIFVLTSCGTVEKYHHETLTASQMQSYAQKVLTPEELAIFEVPYEISPELASLAKQVQVPGSSNQTMARKLALMLLEEGSLGIQYSRSCNYSALEVYEHRKANCISYTNLFVGMARSIGLSVYYTEVTEVDSFDKVGDTVVYNSHVCAVLFSGPNSYLVDFALRDYPQYHAWRSINDLEATANFYNNIGSHYYLKREDPDYAEKAKTYFNMALKLYPDSPQIFNNLGVLMMHEGDAVGAENMFRKALAIQPGYFAAYNNLGSIYIRKGEPERAIELVKEAINASPENQFAYHTLARLYINQGNYEEAESALRKALRIDKTFTAARHELGRLYLRMGRGQDALKQFALALKYHPDDDIAKGKVELIRRLALDQK